MRNFVLFGKIRDFAPRKNGEKTGKPIKNERKMPVFVSLDPWA